MSNITPIRTLSRSFAAALLAIGSASTVHARPTDPGWSPLQAAPQDRSSDRVVIEGPFKGPRNTIPSVVRREPVLTQLALAEQAEMLRYVGPRNTVPVVQ